MNALMLLTYIYTGLKHRSEISPASFVSNLTLIQTHHPQALQEKAFVDLSTALKCILTLDLSSLNDRNSSNSHPKNPDTLGGQRIQGGDGDTYFPEDVNADVVLRERLVSLGYNECLSSRESTVTLTTTTPSVDNPDNPESLDSSDQPVSRLPKVDYLVPPGSSLGLLNAREALSEMDSIARLTEYYDHLRTLTGEGFSVQEATEVLEMLPGDLSAARQLLTIRQAHN